MTCTLAAGQSCQITLQFQAPANAIPTLFPIYSGFIYVTNTNNGQSAHLSCKNSFLSMYDQVCMFFIDAGMVGDYSNAQIIVQSSTTTSVTGITDSTLTYATDQLVLTLNATNGLNIIYVLAWSTRYLQIEAVTPEDTSQPNTGSSSR